MKKGAFLPFTELVFAWDASLDGRCGIPSRLAAGAGQRSGTGRIEHWVHHGSVEGIRVWVHMEEGAVGIGATVALVKLANSLSVLHGAFHSDK